ncbi:MAG TPA: DNA-processing protein DprA [Gemmataceae bacterium]|jgi:DNA processing protein|nr:DNA-processing protein DprA [Gemmataceae bacterium]
MPVSLSSELRDLLTLQLVPGLGPRLTAALLDRFGSARAVLEAGPEQLCEVPHIGQKLAGELHQAMHGSDLTDELELIDRHDVRLLALGTADYPTSVSTIPDPPHLLYIRGRLEPGDANAVALVGSRSCTAYGRRVTEQLATGLVHKGFTVVSGLARGIDGHAHRAALKAGGRTLAVLAGGLSRIYPPEHTDLAREVAASGALLSEANMAMEPLAGMFPARNRIISGLCRGVVIVEAAQRSGALITASHAAEQGRTVFAVPGPIDGPASGGANELIRKGATLCRGVEDIIEELDGVAATLPPVRPASPPPGLDAVELRVWELLAEQPRHLDELARELKLAVPQLSGALMALEMRKAVRRLPGNRYERC